MFIHQNKTELEMLVWESVCDYHYIFMVGTYQITAIQIMIPVIIPAEKHPKAIGIVELLSSKYRVSVGPENTSGEVVSGGSELNKSMHVLIVTVFNGVGHCLLRPNEEPPTVILEVSSVNNHESSILMRVLATMVPLESRAVEKYATSPDVLQFKFVFIKFSG